MLPLNRIGGARGPNGTTLEHLLIQLELMNSKLDTLIASTPPATDLSGLLDAIGTRSDCPTGESMIGLLCRLNDSVAGTPTTGPLDPCPGYEESPFVYAASWRQNLYPNAPLAEPSTYYAILAGSAIPQYLTTANYPYTNEPDDDIQVPVFIPVFNLQNICISGNNGSGGGLLHIGEFNPSTGAIISYSPITTTIGAQTFQFTYSTQSDRMYTISWDTFIDPPGAFTGQVWVSIGVLG